MSPLIIVYVLLIAAIIIGVLIAALAYRRRRGAGAPGQAHIATPLPKDRPPPRP